MTSEISSCIAFEGSRRIAAGTIVDVALAVKPIADQQGHLPVLIFDDQTSRIVEIDFRGTPQEVADRLASPAETAPPAETRGVGRPRLGVVGREVTLLPRHWDWLNSQPGGASVALRKLVEEARRTHQKQDAQRQAQEAAYQFMRVMAGNEPGFEEASRALFGGNRERFEEETRPWPTDVQTHARQLAARYFDGLS